VYITETERISQMIKSSSGMTLEETIMNEIINWQKSDTYEMIRTSERYMRNENKIKSRKRQYIDKDGVVHEEKNLANNTLAHNFLWKLINQKTGYLISKPFSVSSDNEGFHKALNDAFDDNFRRNFKDVGEEAIEKAISWWLVHYDENGKFALRKIPSEQIIPLWADEAHTKLDAVIRVYNFVKYVAKTKTIEMKVEYWDVNGTKYYVLKSGKLVPDMDRGAYSSHFSFVDANGNELKLNWDKVPFVFFKYNKYEIPLLAFIKDHIDDYDRNKSDNSNNLQDLPNFIYVLTNYDGQNLGEFRRNLAAFRAVKVVDDGTGRGGVATLSAPVETDAVKTHIDIARRDIFEFGRGVDTTSEKFTSPNTITIKSLYADLDTDCNNMEIEFKSSYQDLFWFLKCHFYNIGLGDFFDAKANITFNRDIITVESEAIKSCQDSMGILSEETVIENHPWITDAKAEMERKKKEQEDSEKFVTPPLTEYDPSMDPTDATLPEGDNGDPNEE